VRVSFAAVLLVGGISVCRDQSYPFSVYPQNGTNRHDYLKGGCLMAVFRGGDLKHILFRFPKVIVILGVSYNHIIKKMGNIIGKIIDILNT
jgi:hypothetical protein